MALILSEDDVRAVISMDDALECVETVVRQQALGQATNRARRRVQTPRGTLHVMFGGAPALGVLGLKSYTSFRGGTRFHITIYDAGTGELLSIMQGDLLGVLRTGAASGVATKHMARADARTLGVIGTGWQARGQVNAICKVRPIATVLAFGRDEERRKRFAADMSRETGVEVVPADSAEAAVREADVAVTITSSRTPVLLGDWLKPGAHVNAAGANSLLRAEIDLAVVRKAGRIVVDSKEAAQLECGDLLEALERGFLYWEA
ncbi:MAG: ornithine cyclodeaminase family protein, partial [Chloroflexi bacterium]|nr:ornithine cyclodeaminase family protein [Chloroflexota bacterium]